MGWPECWRVRDRPRNLRTNRRETKFFRSTGGQKVWAKRKREEKKRAGAAHVMRATPAAKRRGVPPGGSSVDHPLFERLKLTGNFVAAGFFVGRGGILIAGGVAVVAAGLHTENAGAVAVLRDFFL